MKREEFDKAFKARLRLARESAGLTQEDVARALSVPTNTYSKYENRGRSLLPTHLIADFCALTSCDPWYLLAGRTKTRSLKTAKAA